MKKSECARPSTPDTGTVGPLRDLLLRWREDVGGTYQTWFLWEERLKNFRSIRRGIGEVVREIEQGTFGNVYKGSSLETVVGSIAEPVSYTHLDVYKRQLSEGVQGSPCGSAL